MGIRKRICAWLPVLISFPCGLFVYLFLTGCSFLGLVIIGLSCGYVLHLFLRYLRKRHRKLGNLLLGIFYTLLLAGLVACTWAGILIGTAAKGNPKTPCDYIIVLGAGVNGTTPSLSLQWRIDAACNYLTAHPDTRCIVSGGQGKNEDISEAQCMYDRMTARGIDGSRILLEDKATDTRENIAFSMELIRQEAGSDPGTVGILSSEYHLYRAGMFAQQQGLEAVGIPADTQWPLLFLSYYIREICAVMYYSVFG